MDKFRFKIYKNCKNNTYTIDHSREFEKDNYFNELEIVKNNIKNGIICLERINNKVNSE